LIDEGMPTVGAAMQRKTANPLPDADFRQGGRHLMKGFLDHYLVGLIFNAVIWVSILLCLVTLAALFWRCLDWPYLVDRIQSLWWGKTLYSDTVRPFIPCAVATLIWFVSWLFSYRRARLDLPTPRRFAPFVLACMAISALIGAAVFLGSSEFTQFPWRERSENGVVHGRVGIEYTLAGLVLLMLLPFINPTRMLRSELKPPGKVLSEVRKYCGGALLLCLPFFAIYIFAREDVAGQNRNRVASLEKLDIAKPADFIDAMVRNPECPFAKTLLAATADEFSRKADNDHIAFIQSLNATIPPPAKDASSTAHRAELARTLDDLRTTVPLRNMHDF
jgi:hypothetical protein